MRVRQRRLQGTEAAASQSWRLRAACRHVDCSLFFGPDGEEPTERAIREARAKAICGRCPVILPCAAYAFRHGEQHGVWGGLSERERVAVAHGRHRALPTVPPADADRVGCCGR